METFSVRDNIHFQTCAGKIECVCVKNDGKKELILKHLPLDYLNLLYREFVKVGQPIIFSVLSEMLDRSLW